MTKNSAADFGLLFFCILLSAPLFAVQRQDQTISFRRLSLKEGLSQSNVQAIIRDRRGFMWFGTEDGLNRYDGYQFKIYRTDPDDSTSIKCNYISKILEDQRGHLWIATLGGGLNMYYRKYDNFIRYKIPNADKADLKFQQIYDVIQDMRGNLWLGCDTDGLVYLDLKNNTTVQYLYNDDLYPNCLNYDDVWALCEDSHGRIWIGTYGGGVNVLDPETQRFTHYMHNSDDPASLSHNEVICIYEDSHRNIWIGTYGGGLNRYNPDKDTFTRYVHDPKNPRSLGDNVVFSIIEDTDKNLWIGTENSGLNLFHPQSGEFSHYKQNLFDPRSLSHNSVETIYDDRGGIIWVGTYNGGVNYINKRGDKFRLYQQTVDPASLSSSTVLCFLEDRQGAIWIGTDGGGLNYFDRDKDGFVHHRHQPENPKSLGHDAVMCLYEDRRGRFWAGTYAGGLNHFNRKTGTFKHYKHIEDDPTSLSDNDVRAVHEDHLGNLWVGTLNGLNVMDRDQGKFRHYFHMGGDSTSLSYDGIITIFQDSRNRLWIGTYGGGLNLYDYQKDGFRSFAHDASQAGSLSNNYILSMYEDAKGRLWIGTGGGLNLFQEETQTFQSYFVRDGLVSDFISGILEDDHGNLWLSTHGGLSKFNPDARTFRNYDLADGLQSNDFHYGTCLKASTGEMYFGGVNGFNLFHPDAVKDNPVIPPVWITDFHIDNKPVEIGGENSPLEYAISESEELVLSHDHSVISFEFAALNYILPGKNEYAYFLEGFDEDWNFVGTKRSATYTNLDPKEYTFHVKGSNNDGIWNEAGTALRIIVKPPFWQTTWFRAASIFMICLFIYSIYLIRTIPIREKNKELESINIELKKHIDAQKKAEKKMTQSLKEKDVLLREIHHRVKNNLQVITSILSLQSEFVKNPDALRMFTESMDRIKSMALVHERLYHTKDMAMIDFSEYINSLVSDLHRTYAAGVRSVKFEVDVRDVALDISKAVPCGLIINELVSNSLKHGLPMKKNRTAGSDGRIWITFHANGHEQYVLIVRDNGVGLPENWNIQDTQSLGLKLVERLAKQLNGSITYKSQGGCEFKIVFEDGKSDKRGK